MGWSCAAAAGATLDKWTAYCVETTGSQNTFKIGKDSYFFDVSRKEWDDGRITGTVYRVEGDATGDRFMSRKVGSFCIGADGTPVRAPACLKALGNGTVLSRLADALRSGRF